MKTIKNIANFIIEIAIGCFYLLVMMFWVVAIVYGLWWFVMG